MNLAGWKEKISELLEKCKETVAILAEKIGTLVDPLLDRIPEKKRKPLLYGLGGLVVVLLILIISSIAINAGRPGRSAPQNISSCSGIPTEDLFIPSEPDFLPEFILEREPRRFWAIEDLRPYWRSPENNEFWQGELRSTVDSLMEGIP